MKKNDYTEDNIKPFNNEHFIERANRATAPYGYTYENCAYLRFCFLLYYFEIDICHLREIKDPHVPEKKEIYDFNYYLKKTIKEFFFDIPRSNRQKNFFALQPYIMIFEETISQMDFYGLYPDVKIYMRDILLHDTNTQTIISEYENFIAFFSKMVSYLKEHYDSNCSSFIHEVSFYDSDFIGYNNNSEFYIDCLTNNYTQEVWYDVSRYPTYINLNTETIHNDITNNPKFWNFIFENWNVFLLLSEELLIWHSFKHNFSTRVRDINKCISNLFTGNDYSRTDLLLNNAEKYSCLYSISFTMPNRTVERIQRNATKVVQTFREKQCYLFCKENMEILSKLNKHNIRLLFRIACLAEGTPQETPRYDLNSFCQYWSDRFTNNNLP